jgi:hypothetical protein
MDDDTSQSNMASAKADGATPWVAAQLPTPATHSSSQVTPSPTPMFHPDSLVTLLVGPEEEKMVVHETYLSRDSPFFKAALKKQWTEGQTRVIKLPEESLEPMQHYIEHLYGAKLPTNEHVAGSLCTADSYKYVLLAQLYVLGERLLNAKYQNAIIHEIFRLSHVLCGLEIGRRFPAGCAVDIIYGGTTSGSPARRMLVDFATAYGHESWHIALNPDSEYWRDLSKALFKKLAAQKTMNDFRNAPMAVEDYLVSEEA